MPDYTVKWPLEFSNKTNGFETIDQEKLKELVVFNLKNILLTEPGERIMHPSFGVGIKRFLFEQGDQVDTETLATLINTQIKIWANYVFVEDLQIQFQNDTLSVFLKYEVKQMSISDFLLLEIAL